MIRAGALALLAIAIHLPNYPANRPPHEDAGVFLYAANLLRFGGVPYRDVWDHKPPLIYELDAIGLTLGGGSEAGVWALQAAGFVGATLVGYRLLAGTFGPPAAVVGTASWLLAAPELVLVDGQFTNFVQLYAPLLQWASLSLFVRGTPGAMLAAGSFGGGAALLSPTLCGIWIGAALILVRRRALSAVALLAAGTAAAVVVAILPFVVSGALDELLDQALRYNTVYTRDVPLSDRLEAVRWGLQLTLSSGLALLAFVGWLMAVGTSWRRVPLVSLAALALPIDLLLSGASGRAYDHYYIAWLPTMAVLASLATAVLLARARRLAPRAALRPAIASALVVGATVGLMGVRPAGVVARALAAEEDGASRIAARYLAAETTANETAYIWGSRTESLFMAGRRAPTRYVYPYGPLFTVGYSTEEKVDELLADLRRARPAIILDASAASPVTPPLDARAMRVYDTHDRLFRVPASLVRLVEFIEENYVRQGDLPYSGWPVYVRRDRSRG